MNTRAVVFTEPGEVEVREQPLPEPTADEVRVRTEVSAISPGTELLIYRGETPTKMAIDETIDALAGTFEFPLSYGYAVVGRVTATGTAVSDTWLGRPVFAFQPHTSHFTVSPNELVPVPENCSMERAAFLANVECAVNFLMDGRPVIGERVGVYGQGAVGLLTTGLLAEYPLGSLVTVDLYDHRRELSERFGADEALDPTECDVVERLRTGDEPGGTDLTYELTGDPTALDRAIDAMAYDSRLVVGSWYGTKRVSLDLGGRFHRNRGQLISSQVSTIPPRFSGRWSKDRRLDVALELLESLDLPALITHRVPIKHAPEAYRLLDECPDEAVQVLFTYD